MAYHQYKRSAIAEMADWHEGFDMTDVSVSDADKQAGSPKAGDKIARNPKNHADRWLVAAAYFADNFEPLTPTKPAVPEPLWAAVERYADEVAEYNAALKIDVGVDAAGKSCLAAEAGAREAIRAAIDAAVAEARATHAKELVEAHREAFVGNIQAVSKLGLDAMDAQPLLLAVQNWDISTGRARELLRCWVLGTFKPDMMPECGDDLFEEAEEPRTAWRTLRAEADALRAALQPFADTDLTNPLVRDTFGFDVLRARAALQEQKP